MSVFHVLRTVMTAVGVLFLPAVFIFPQLKAHMDLFTWILFGVYLLVVLFLWGISGRGNRAGHRRLRPGCRQSVLE